MQLTARTWVAATVVVALLLALAAWFVLIDPVRAEAADLRSQTADAVARNEQLASQTQVLRQQFANLPDKEAELAALGEALPAEVELPTLIRTVDGFADETGVTVMSIAPGAATPVVDPAVAAAAAAPAPAPTEGAAPADGAAAPVEPVVPAGPVTMATPLTTTVIGDFFDAQAFLRRMQADMPRAFLVRDLSVTAEDRQDAGGGRPATTAGDVTMTITADVFSRPDPAGAAGAATTPPATSQPSTPVPTTPAPGASPAPGATLAPSPGPDGGAPATPPPGPGAPLPSQEPAAAT